MIEPIIPDEWVRIEGKKLSDFIDMTGENGDQADCPVYFDKDSEGYLYLRKEVFGGEELMAAYRVARRPNDDQSDVDLSVSDDPMARMGQGFCPPFDPHTYEAAPGVICMQDQAVAMRDGATIYCDIYRPDTDEKVPVIVSWSWFGKRPGEDRIEVCQVRIARSSVLVLPRLCGRERRRAWRRAFRGQRAHVHPSGSSRWL